MKKLLYLLAIAILPATQSYCQTTSFKSNLSISAGPSLPLGNFPKTDLLNNEAGFANIGQNIGIAYSYKLNKHLGLVGRIYGQRNGLNTGAMSDAYSHAGFFAAYGSIRKYPNWEVEKSPWLTGSVMVGLSEEIAVSQSGKVSMIVIALTGLTYVQSPKIDANSKSDTSYTELKRDKSHAIGQSFLLGGGLKYAIGKRTSIILNAEYAGTSKVSFEDVHEIVVASDGGLIIPGFYSIKNAYSVIGTEYNGSFKQRVSALNINLGFSFSF